MNGNFESKEEWFIKINVYTLNSFAKSIEGGNRAGVVLNADALSESDVKKIAKIVICSPSWQGDC